MTEDNILDSKDDKYYENFLQDHLAKKYNSSGFTPTPVTVTPLPTPLPTPPASPIITPPIPPTIPPITLTTPPVIIHPTAIPHIATPTSPITIPPLPKITSNITTAMLKEKILTPVRSQASASASSSSTYSPIVTTDVFSDKSNISSDEKASSKSPFSINSNIEVEDMKRIHPDVYDKISNLLRNALIGGKIDTNTRDEVNNLLQSYQKAKLSSGTWKVNTVLKQFAHRFMKTTNSPY